MRTAYFTGYFLLLFFPAISNGQQNNPLINSAEVISNAYKKYESKDYREAIRLYGQVNRSDTNYYTALFELSNSYYADSQFNKSLEIAKMGMNVFPEKFSSFAMQIANSYDNLKNPAAAQLQYDSAIKINPHNYLLYFNKAITNYNQKLFDEAKTYFRKSLMINPYYGPSHFFLGSVYMQEGNLIPAMMALSAYLIINPDGKYKSSAISYLNDITKATDDVLKYVKNRKNNERAFNSIQNILLSKIAYDSKYKSEVDIDDPIVKQLQVVFEKLEYDKNDAGFAMQYYVPFYTKVYKEKEFEAMVFHMFSDVDLPKIKSWLKRNKKETEDFITHAADYLNEIKFTRVENAEERLKIDIKYIYKDSKLTARGVYAVKKKETIALGKWEFYNDEGGLRMKGEFSEEGLRTGVWTTMYDNGKIKEKTSYQEGKANGLSEGWFENGNKWYEEKYKQGSQDGIQTYYYYNGNKKSVLNYSMDKKTGEQKYYSYKGSLTNTYNYQEDKLEGPYKNYYENGKVSEESAYANSLQNGGFKSYYESGAVNTTGEIVAGKREGLWTTYFEDKKIKEKTTYKGNDVTGEFSEYYNNGTLSSIGYYVKKKLDGKISHYGEDGKLYSEVTYERGKLRELKFLDKKGNVISSTTTRKGAATIVFYNESGVKVSEGFFDKEGSRQGKFISYFSSGKISEETNWKNDEKNGSSKGLYPNGKVKWETNYINGEEDGYIKSYYINGQIKKEGWVVKGLKQQTWIYYNLKGDVEKKEYYLNDNLDGYTQFYYPGNILDYEFRYRNGWLDQVIQYDTTGKIIQDNDLTGGGGKIIYRHNNGKIYSEVGFKNYMSNGLKTNYFFDGSISTQVNKLNDENDGKFTDYFYGGKVRTEGNYSLGNKTGTWKYYYNSGILVQEDNYKDGEQDGISKIYSRDGRLERTITYKNNELDGPMIYYGEKEEKAVVLNFESGTIMSYQYTGTDDKLVPPIIFRSFSGKVNALYQNGKPSAFFEYDENNIEGKTVFYYSNGNKMSEGNMIEGVYDGLVKSWYSDGKKCDEETYLLGDLNGKSAYYFPDGTLENAGVFYNDERHGVHKFYDTKSRKLTTRTYFNGILQNVK